MKFILFIGMFTFCTGLHSQTQFHLKNQKLNQIFSENISDLAIDSFGYLWIGTSNGVIRYDGSNIERFQNEGEEGNSLHGNYVYHILPRVDSSVWVSTYGGGISMYDPHKNDFRTLLHSANKRSIQENRVTGMHSISKDSILVNYRGIDYQSGGFSLLDGSGNLIGHYLNEYIQDDGYFFRYMDMSIDKSNIWIPAQKLYKINRSNFSYLSFDFPFPVLKWDDIKAIEVINDSKLIIGSNEGLYTYEWKLNKWTTLLSKTYIKEIKAFGNSIYILSPKQIYELDKSTGKISTLYHSKAIHQYPNLRFSAIEVDHKHIWLGSNKGLFRFDLEGSIVKITSLESNKVKNLKSIKNIGIVPRSANKLHVDYSGHILEQTEAQKVNIINKVGNKVHGTIIDFLQKDHYLFATDDGIFEYNVKDNLVSLFLKNSSLESLLEKEPIWSIYNNSIDSILWIGTRTKGLVKYDVARDTFINFRHDPNTPHSLCFDRYLFKISPGLDGNLWISTDKGLSVIDPKTNRFVLYPKLMDKLSDYIIHHNVAGDKYMWIGTRDHGLFRYDIEADEVKIYTIRQGLPFTGANRLIFDQGILFVSSIKGVCTLNESNDKIKLFDESTGIDLGDLYYCKLNIDEDNLNVSGGNSNKIYQIPKLNFTTEVGLNPILIETIQTSTSDTSITYHYPEDNLKLSAEEDNFVVTFTNIEYDRRTINYRYRLDGYDQQWTESNDARFASYSHIPGGSYRFVVQSSLPGRGWEQEEHIDILIHTFWYRTWWFYALSALGFVITFGLLFKISMDKINLKKSYQLMLSNAELKALRAQMNPHFVFNSLNSIKSFIIENDRRNATDYLNKFSKLMRLILNHSKSNLISLSDEIQAIGLYIDMERLRFNSFDFALDIDDQLPTDDFLVPPMIIQPYLENAIWHGLQHKKSGQGKLLLQITLSDNDTLHVIIRDNGVGRTAASSLKSKSALEKKSHGMNITNDRLNLSQLDKEGESVKIIDLYEAGKASGTEIQIILPYTKSELYEN